MDLALRTLLVGLAAWRVSALLSYERGPFGVFDRFRAAVAVPSVDGELDLTGRFSRLRLEAEQLLSCVWCLSPWTAIAVWFLWDLSPEAVAIGAAAVVIVLVERLAR